MDWITKKLDDGKIWAEEHKTPLTYIVGSALIATYLLYKPVQKFELKGEITLIQPNPSTPTPLSPSGSYKELWTEDMSIPSYQAGKSLTLPSTRFEHTPQLSGENYQELWQTGDFTVRGTIPEGLVVDQHTLYRQYDWGVVDVKRQPYHIHLTQGELARLGHVIENWRLDDVLRPISVNGNEIRFVHRLTSENFTGSLVDIGEKSTLWLITLENY